jgi:hypothetical protein
LRARDVMTSISAPVPAITSVGSPTRPVNLSKAR